MKVCVVIVTFNNKQMLMRLLSDLREQTIPPDDTIVFDNASIDGTGEAVRSEYLGVKYIRSDTNIGSAGGFHEGIRAAIEDNDMVWLMDDDVSVDRTALERLLAAYEVLRKGKKIGAVRSWGGASDADFQSPERARSFAWRGTLIPTEAIRMMGLPRDDYFLYGEDTEYSLRLSKRGYEFYWVPDSRVQEKRLSDKIYRSASGSVSSIYKDAFRLYYAHRNQFNIALQYRDMTTLLSTISYGLKVIAFFLINYDRKKSIKKITAVLCGLADGARGRLGEDPRYRPIVPAEYGKV